MVSIQVEKLVTSAVSAAGSAILGRVGDLAAGEVLDLLGVPQVSLADLQSNLADIKSTLADIKTTLGAIDTKLSWIYTITSYKGLLATVEGPFDNIAAIVAANDDQQTRDGRLKAYLGQLDADDIEKAYNTFRDDALGHSSLFGVGQTLPAQMYATKWADLFGGDLPIDTAAGRVMAICYRLLDLMHRAAILVFNIRAISDRRLGAAFYSNVAGEMRTLRRAFIVEAPSMIAYCATGYPEVAGVGSGWDATFRTTLPGVSTPYLKSSPVVYLDGHHYATNMSDLSSEAVTLVTHGLAPLRFRLENPRQMAMSVGPVRVMTHPGRDGYSSSAWGDTPVWYEEQDPTTQIQQLVVFTADRTSSGAASHVATLRTTAKPGEYAVMTRPGTYLTAVHRTNTPTPVEVATVGARWMDNCNAGLDGTKGAGAVWAVELRGGSDAIYRAMS